MEPGTDRFVEHSDYVKSEMSVRLAVLGRRICNAGKVSQARRASERSEPFIPRLRVGLVFLSAQALGDFLRPGSASLYYSLAAGR